MTALEEQLTRALRRLSAQYETEQRRHSGQVEALRQHVERLSTENEVLQRQIEQLDVLATRLAEYFGTSSRDRAASIPDAPPGTGSRSRSEPLMVVPRGGADMSEKLARTPSRPEVSTQSCSHHERGV